MQSLHIFWLNAKKYSGHRACLVFECSPIIDNNKNTVANVLGEVFGGETFQVYDFKTQQGMKSCSM